MFALNGRGGLTGQASASPIILSNSRYEGFWRVDADHRDAMLLGEVVVDKLPEIQASNLAAGFALTLEKRPSFSKGTQRERRPALSSRQRKEHPPFDVAKDVMKLLSP